MKRFTENAVHRGAVSSVRFTIRSFFIFGSVRFIRSFLVPLRQIKKRKKKRRKKAIKNLICHFCKIARLQFYLFLESSYLTIVFLSCNRFINFTFINTRAACLPKWLTVKLRMLPRSLNQSWQYFGFENIIDKNGIRTLDKSKTVCKECRAQISYGTGNTTNMFTHRQRKHPHLYDESNANKTKPSQVSSSVKGVAPLGGQQTIKGAFQAKLNTNSPRALECTKSIGMFMAKDLGPFSVADNPCFRYMVNTLEPRYKIP